uniref:Uncharacterized protein n=1 Tax=viral metagenome TaxID=1070528 RepID=A0A6M3XFG7_9ZZZZ
MGMLMKSERIDELLVNLEPFGFRSFENAITLFSFLETKGFSSEELKELRADLAPGGKLSRSVREQFLCRNRELLKLRKLCPKCEAPLRLFSINTPKGKRNLFGYRTVWLCEGKTCFYEEFSFSPKYEEFLKLLKKEI